MSHIILIVILIAYCSMLPKLSISWTVSVSHYNSLQAKVCLCLRNLAINKSHVFYCPIECILKMPKCVVHICLSKTILTVSKVHSFEEKKDKSLLKTEHGLWSVRGFFSVKIVSAFLFCAKCLDVVAVKKLKTITRLVENTHSVSHCCDSGNDEGSCHLL